MIVRSEAQTWAALAVDLLVSIDRLDASIDQARIAASIRSILLIVAPDLRSVALHWCDHNGNCLLPVEPAIKLEFILLPGPTDTDRDDGVVPPHGSLDRAISKVCAEMFSWCKDSETFELIERQRYRLFLRWPSAMPNEVDPFAYGLWDE